MLKNKIKNIKGITLIALVITIVVLVILAAVALSVLLDDNGLLDKAKIAKQEYTHSQENETSATDDYENHIDNINNPELFNSRATKHTSVTSSLFTVSYSSGSANVGAKTRRIADFASNISQSDSIGNYFTYDTENKKLICKEAGQYVLNLSSRACKNSSDGCIEGSFVINDVTIPWADSWFNGSNSEVYTGNIITLYLNENDTVDFTIYNSNNVNYYKLFFYVYAN